MERLLHIVGVTAGQERIYRILLDRDEPATCDDLAAATNTAADDVSAALTALEQLGLAVALEASGWVALDAEVALLTLAGLRGRDVEVLRRSAPAIGRRLGRPCATAGAREVQIVHSEAVLRRHLADVAATAQRRLRYVDPHPVPDLELALGDGVTQQLLYQHGIGSDDALRPLLAAPSPTREVRLAHTLPARLIIADEQLALVIADTDGGLTRGVLLRPSAVLTAFVAAFDAWWAAAYEIGEPADMQGAAWRLDDDDRRLLRLLNRGLTDTAIARELGIGVRTVVRRVGHLVATFDAETRFQLGVQAARRGFL